MFIDCFINYICLCLNFGTGSSFILSALIENIEKHRDTVYELNGDIATRNQRVDIFTCAMDRLFSYKKTSKPEKYELYTGTGFFSYLDYMNCLRKKKKKLKIKKKNKK